MCESRLRNGHGEWAYWDEARKRWEVEAEPVEIELGGSSANVQATGKVRVE